MLSILRVALFALCLPVFSLSLQAQSVLIPDAHFRTYLETNYPTCISSGMLDINCTEVTSATEMDLTNLHIADLTGIEYFTGLETLNCSENDLISLPALPAGLKELFCVYNDLTSLPSLPAGLKSLNCAVNQLTGFPALPANLEMLDFTGNYDITVMPALPSTLTHLSFAYCGVTELGNLPESLIYLDGSNNQISSITDLPAGLITLECSGNTLTAFELPSALKSLNCTACGLTSLPELPNSLILLSCPYNSITHLPEIQENVNTIICGNNELHELPHLPSSLLILHCDNNHLSCLPHLPSNLFELIATDNSIQCLPNFPLYRVNAAQAFTSDIGTTVCEPAANPNDCALYPIISGTVYRDDNANGVKDNGEIGVSNVEVWIDGIYLPCITDSEGFYQSAPLDTAVYYVYASPATYPVNYSSETTDHEVDVTTFANSGSGNDFPLVSEIPTALQSNDQNNKWSVYPNPSQGIVHISSVSSSKGLLQIINAAGESVQQLENIEWSTVHRLDLSAMPKGMYMLQFISDEERMIQKIILN
jgi:hypothetical protein